MTILRTCVVGGAEQIRSPFNLPAVNASTTVAPRCAENYARLACT